MLRSTIAGALALLLTLAPVSAQTDGSGNSDTVLSGRARGAWDLPTHKEPGRMRGVLFHAGQRDFVIEAILTPLTATPTLRTGRLDGALLVVSRDGEHRRVAEVHGKYSTIPGRRGYFEAAITKLPTDSRTEPEVLGKIGGVFADPMRDGRDPVGRFLGRWAIVR